MKHPPPIKSIGFLEGFKLGLLRRWKPHSPSQLPSVSSRTFRRVTDDDLAQLAAGWAPGTWQRLLADMELKRREGRTARLALAISFASLVVSIASVAIKSAN